MLPAVSRAALLWLALASFAVPVADAGAAETAAASASASVTPEILRTAAARYAEHVYQSYVKAAADAEAFRAAAHALAQTPSSETLEAAKKAWLAARPAYGLTEAFRYYEGPIDAAGGSEARLNSWPVNEAYIDATEGAPASGIVNDPAVTEITKALIFTRNQAKDEADVSSGWHAAEFLLWGQDKSPDGPGARPVSDFIGETGAPLKRRQYIAAAADGIADDLNALKAAWDPARSDNYATSWRAMPPKEALGKAFTGLITLSGFELAGERLGAALDSGDQEDEQSCFSDSTAQDILADVRGLHLAFATLAPAAAAANPDLAAKTEAQLRQTVKLAEGLMARPFDVMLRSAKDSDPRKQTEALVASLAALSGLLKETAAATGVQASMKTD